MTDIEIVNVALGMLGKKGILTFDDDTNQARLAKSIYANTRDLTLEARVWTFALRRLVLDQKLAASPAFGYLNAFQIPATVARVHRVTDELGFDIDWKKEGANILADEEKVYVVAVMKEEDTSKFSPGFCDALGYALAVKMAIPLTQNRTLMADMDTLYKAAIKEAAGTDGSQGRNEKPKRSLARDLRR